MNARIVIPFLASLLVSPCAAARDAGAPASVRLVAAGDMTAGSYRAAVVIDLAPNTITYWRNPGEAGVPPTFDFSGSTNLARADAAMPAPTRINEAGGDVFGYTTQVAFPVAIAPVDAGKPVSVALKLDYAACEKICVPMRAEAQITLAPGDKAGPDAALVNAAFAAIPRRVDAAEAAQATPVAGASKPTWRIAPKAGDAVDLFAEGPDGYFFETVRADKGFDLVMAERPKDAKGPAPVRLTLQTRGGAIEFELRLDAGRSAP